jgi:two-component system, NarL family, response regulator NreC
MTTIILADDHHLVRKALKILLQSQAGFDVIAEAADGTEAIELVEKKKPDILLLDLAIPRTHGLDVIRHVCKTKRTKVLVVSMHSADTYVIEAMKNGAGGYVLKQSSPADLIKAVRQVCAGKTYLSPALPIREIMASLRNKSDGVEKFDGDTPMTRREKIVLQLAAEGNNNTQIARLLYLSPRTVESHRASFMRKLKLRSQTEIVRYAIRKNIISA